MNEAKRLRRKLFIFQGIVLALFCLAVAAGVSIPLYQHMTGEIERGFTTSANNKAAAVSQWILRAEDLARQITSRTRIRQELQKYNRQEISLRELVRFTAPKLQDAMRLSKEVVGITRRDAKGEVVVSLGIRPPALTAEMDSFSSGQISFGRPFLWRGKSHLWVRAPITGRQGVLAGSDTIVVTTHKLVRVMRCSPSVGTGQTPCCTFLFAVQKNGLAQAVPGVACNVSKIAAEPGRGLLNAANGAMSGRETARFNFKGMFCVALPVEYSAWALVSCLDEDLIRTSILKELSKVLVWALLLYGLCLLACWLVLHPLARRILMKHSELEVEVESKTGSLQNELEARRQAEEALAKQSQKLTFILEGTNVGTWEWNIQTGECRFNERWASMAGYTLEELEPVSLDTWVGLVHPGDRKASEKILEKHFRGELDFYECEARMRHKNGDWIWVLDRGKVATWSEDGKPILMSGTHQDITERKKAEEALRKSEAMLARSQAMAHMGHWDSDIIDNIVTWSDEVYRIFGIKPQELEVTREAFLEAVHPKDRDLVALAINRSLYNRQPYNIEHRVVRKNGEVRFVHENAEVYFDESGNPVRMVGTVQDITERKQAEKALQENEERLRNLINATPDMICFKDAQKRWQEANYANLELFSLTGVDYQGKTDSELAELTDPCYREAFLACDESDEKAWQHGSASRSEEAIPKPDGSVKVYDVIKVPLFNPDGSRRGLIVWGRDITERKQAEEAKGRLESQLRQAQKMEAIGTLAGGIAHDFNNILAAITGYSELALDDALNGEASPDEIRQILRAADRAKGLVRQILTYSRKMGSELKPLNLNKVISDTFAVVERTIPKMISTELKLKQDLPLIKGDYSQIESVLLNLVTNARDAMPNGGRLVIRTENVAIKKYLCSVCGGLLSGLHVCVSVSDAGHGMDEETASHVFDPFFTTKEVGKGTGLGMSTAFGIISEHGGHIECESELGKGTTFRLFFPVLSEGTEPELTELEDNGDIPGGSETVLMVDDEKALQSLSRDMLSKAGYKTIAAGSGEEALEIYRHKGSDIGLVVLDISMPGMGGYKCLQEIIRIDPQAKVIIASGYAQGATLQQTLEAGAAKYIAKPYRKTDFLKSVREVLDS